MADIQSVAAEIRRGKKKERKKKKEERTNHSMKIYMVSLLHRATIKKVAKNHHLGTIASHNFVGLYLCN